MEKGDGDLNAVVAVYSLLVDLQYHLVRVDVRGDFFFQESETYM